MRRKTLVLVLVMLFAAGTGEAALFRSRSASGGMFPATGDLPDLVLVGKVLTYKLENFLEFYGKAGNRYVQYGLRNMMIAEYTYGGKGRRLTIELATMESPVASAGLFHHHRGNVVGPKGTAVNVGAEGVLDSSRHNRTLYFYRGNIFAKVIYSGEEPVPDLVPVAAAIDAKLPAGSDAKPEGFSYIEIPGVNKDTIELTPGFTFNYSFLPASVWASAPSGGSPASDLFIITRGNEREATEVFKDYLGYLKLQSDYVEEYQRGGGKQKYVKARDPGQGRVLFTVYRNALIIAARPDGYERGEPLIDQVMERIDAVNPPKKRR